MVCVGVVVCVGVGVGVSGSPDARLIMYAAASPVRPIPAPIFNACDTDDDDDDEPAPFGRFTRAGDAG